MRRYWFSSSHHALRAGRTSMTILCLYRVYILVGKLPNNHSTVVQRCKITCHTSSNSLIIAQHSHLSMRIILRPQKFVHHSCEYTQQSLGLVLSTRVTYITQPAPTLAQNRPKAPHFKAVRVILYRYCVGSSILVINHYSYVCNFITG